MKKGTRILFVVLGCAGLSAIAVAIWPSNPEPEYEGKKLSEWIAYRQVPGYATWPSPRTEAALRQMGPKAVPWMLKWLREPTPKEIKVDQLVSKLPPSIANHSLMRWSRINYSKQCAQDVTAAFFLMGSTGKSAVPGLTALALRKNRHAFYALVNVGPDNVPGLLTLIERRDFPQRVQALRAFGLSPAVVTNLQMALPVAVNCLRDPDPKIATTAAILLLEWHVKPATAVPLLAGALRHPQAEVRQMCADALASFGADAQPAVPALTVCLTDSDPSVRQAASNALFLIEPQTDERLQRLNTEY